MTKRTNRLWITLLLCSLAINIGLVTLIINQNKKHPLVGTYIYNPVEDVAYAADPVYLLLYPNGDYLFYQQGDITIEEGTYIYEESVLTFNPKNDDERNAIITSDGIMCTYNSNDVVLFEFHSEKIAHIMFNTESEDIVGKLTPPGQIN